MRCLVNRRHGRMRRQELPRAVDAGSLMWRMYRRSDLASTYSMPEIRHAPEFGRELQLKPRESILDFMMEHLWRGFIKTESIYLGPERVRKRTLILPLGCSDQQASPILGAADVGNPGLASLVCLVSSTINFSVRRETLPFARIKDTRCIQSACQIASYRQSLAWSWCCEARKTSRRRSLHWDESKGPNDTQTSHQALPRKHPLVRTGETDNALVTSASFPE